MSRRALAVVCFGIGLVLVGVALGLVYMDQRDYEAMPLAVQAGVPTVAPSVQGPDRLPTPAGGEAKSAGGAIQAWHGSERVWTALWSGSLGAGLAGAGLLMAVFELPVFGRRAAG